MNATKKTNDELKVKYAALLCDPLSVHSVTHVNHKPHPYMVGTRHVAYASDHCGGRLGEETLRKIPCAHPGCCANYEAHVSDRVLLLSLTRDTTSAELRRQIDKGLGGMMEEDGIDGLCFVKNAFTIEQSGE